MRLGDIAEVHRDGKEFAPVREWVPGAGLVPGYGYPRRCWSREPVFLGESCVLITANAPRDHTMSAVHYSVWHIEEGPCAYTPDVWRINLTPAAGQYGITAAVLSDKLFDAMNELYDIGAVGDLSEGNMSKLLDFDIILENQTEDVIKYRPEYYYAKKYYYGPNIRLDLPLGLPGLQRHYDVGDDLLTRVTFSYAGADITIHRGYVIAKFSPWDILITDGEILTKWDASFDGADAIYAILCEYGLDWICDDPGESFLTCAWREYICARDAEVKKALPQPIFEELGEHLEV